MTKPLKITLISIGSIAAFLLLAFLFVFFDGRYRLNVLRHRIFSKPDDVIKEEVIPAQRGRILASDGSILVESVGRYDIYMDCTVVEDEDKWNKESLALSQEIARVLPTRSAPEWWGYFREARQRGDKFITIVKDIDLPMKDTLARLPLFREGQFAGGFIAEHYFARVYPYDSLARRTLGYIKPGMESASVGLEGRFNTALAGVSGTKTVKYGMREGKHRLWEIGRIDPIQGYDVRTTLDMDLQATADSALRMAIGPDETLYAGCLVLMEVGTGAIRAMVNLNRTEDGSLKEYYNYAIGLSYEPGEVVSAMTQDTVLPDTLDFDIDGLREAMVDSAGVWTMTPLHVLAFYNTLAAGGKMMKPYLVEQLEPSSGKPAEIVPFGPKVLKEGIPCQATIGSLSSWTDAVYPVIGKKDSATFAGFFPAEDPQYSMVCTIFTNTMSKPAYGGDVPEKVVLDVVKSLEL